MKPVLQGTWHSGRDLAARPATLEMAAESVRVTGAMAPVDFPIRTTRVSDRLGHIPRYLYFPEGSTFETLDNDGVDHMLASVGRGRAAAWLHGLEQHSRLAAAATLVLVASLVAIVFSGLPVMARRAAFAVPPAIELQAGEAALASLRNWLGPSELDGRTRARVQHQLNRITVVRMMQDRPRLEFRAMGRFPNAFAFPGGIIVVSDELVRLATEDEMAAVLAHEVAHWQLRHGLQAVLRNSAALLLVSTVTGDLSTLTAFAGTLPVLLLQRGYSRESEQEADDYAAETLRRAGIDPRNLASILAKLDAAKPDKGVDYSYLSTHPATSDRIRKVDPLGTYKSRAPAMIADLPAESPGGVRWDMGKLVYDPNANPIPKPLEVMPEPIQQVPPTYPPILREAGIEGQVLLDLIVESDGSVGEIRVANSDHHEFEPAAITAVRQWRFKPATRNGEPMRATMRLPVVFRLVADDQQAHVNPIPRPKR